MNIAGIFIVPMFLTLQVTLASAKDVQLKPGAMKKEVRGQEVDYKKLTIDEWKKRLTKEQFKVCRKNGTEKAFSGKYVNMKYPGVYTCVACGQELFRSNEKFDSGTGWPSFWDVIDKANVELHEDTRFFMKRTEIKCSKCGSHLGHVFNDGPDPTGKRYCINSVCLNFKKNESESTSEQPQE